jgi:hypothetical protein
LVDTSRIFGEVIRDLLRDQSGARVVGELHGPSDLRGAMCRTRANCVIVATTAEEVPGPFRELISEFSSVKLLTLVEEGGGGFVWELEPRQGRADSTTMTRQDLLDAIGVG